MPRSVEKKRERVITLDCGRHVGERLHPSYTGAHDANEYLIDYLQALYIYAREGVWERANRLLPVNSARARFRSSSAEFIVFF